MLKEQVLEEEDQVVPQYWTVKIFQMLIIHQEDKVELQILIFHKTFKIEEVEDKPLLIRKTHYLEIIMPRLM